MNASFFKHVQVSALEEGNQTGFVEQVQRLENLVDEMNQSFYDIVNDLEGKYSVHEKEIELLNRDLEKFKKQLNELTSTMTYQGKALKAIKHEDVVAEPEVLTDHVKKGTESQEKLKEEIMKLKALGYDEYQIARSLKKGVREIKMLMDFIK